MIWIWMLFRGFEWEDYPTYIPVDSLFHLPHEWLNHHRNSSAALRASGRSVAVVSSLMFTYPSTLWHGTFLTVGGKEPATGGQQLTVRRSQFDLLTACLAQFSIQLVESNVIRFIRLSKAWGGYHPG